MGSRSTEIDLDFATTSGSRRNYGTGALVTTLFLLGSIWLNAAFDDRIARLTQNLDAQRAQAAQKPKAQPNQSSLELRRARLIGQRLTMPWQSLFTALERAQTHDVFVLQMLPSMADGTVSIEGVAANFRRIDQYAAKLRAAGMQRVVMTSHSKSRQGGSLRFALEGVWNPQASIKVPINE